MREKLFSFLLKSGILKFFKLRPQSLTILCFHRISNDPDKAYPPLSPKTFEGIVSYISQNFQAIDLNKKNKPFTRPKIHITFDDAFFDFKTEALPILIKYNVSATLNVITSCAETGIPHWTQRLSCIIDEYAKTNAQPILNFAKEVPHLQKGKNEEEVSLFIFNQMKYHKLSTIDKELELLESRIHFDKKTYTKMLLWSDINQILNDTDLVTIGSHTVNHLNLGEVTDDDILRQEIIESKEIIENKLGIKVDRFAFPNGEYSSASVKFLEESGYRHIFLTEIQHAPKARVENLEFHYRFQPYYKSPAENIFSIHGFHKIFRHI
jgi:peptidoglycan/xylan/chitin deacetylase (PgdA/CDA1 family)